MPVDQERFEKLLARLSPSFRRKKLLEELEGISDLEHPEKNRPGYQDLFMQALVEAESQQGLVDARKRQTAGTEATAARKEADTAEAEYFALTKWALAEAYCEEVERLKDALEEIDNAEKEAEEIKQRAGTRMRKNGAVEAKA